MPCVLVVIFLSLSLSLTLLCCSVLYYAFSPFLSPRFPAHLCVFNLYRFIT